MDFLKALTKQPKVSEKVRQRRMRTAGHCLQSSNLVLWEPTEGRRKRGIGAPINDIGMDNVLELKTLILDRDGWRRRVHDVGSRASWIVISDNKISAF